MKGSATRQLHCKWVLSFQPHLSWWRGKDGFCIQGWDFWIKVPFLFKQAGTRALKIQPWKSGIVEFPGNWLHGGTNEERLDRVHMLRSYIITVHTASADGFIFEDKFWQLGDDLQG